jgi:predicted dehydrogenase
MRRVGIGLYGANGHQIHRALVDHPLGELIAMAGMARDVLPEPLRNRKELAVCDSLDELLRHPQVELVSLCSPRRRDQAADAVACLEAGRHVYAEKPSAMTEEDLDWIIRTAERTGARFREMAGTAFEHPYWEMRQVVAAGTIGMVVQVLAQKSYPYHDGRPQDEDIDGGLLMQAGVHAARFVEHVAGTRIGRIEAVETALGNPAPGNLQMAAAMMMTLENGGVAGIIANYLNPKAFPSWGNETLRIYGTGGFVEAVDGGTRTRLVLSDTDRGELPRRTDCPDFLDNVLAAVQGAQTPLLPLDQELHPTRMVIRAKQDAERRRPDPGARLECPPPPDPHA